MFSSITRNFLYNEEKGIIKEDFWGFSEFPHPGDTKKHTLPLLIDPEEASQKNDPDRSRSTDQGNGHQLKEFWMPDKYCKNCYGCEEAFTMYRRRHHCRMCGQVFCNNCSSFYIDGSLFNVTGLVRACELCYEQLMERTERENRLNRRKQSDRFNTNSTDHFRSFVPPALTNNKTGSSVSSLDDRSKIHSNNLQNRASKHFEAIVRKLIYESKTILNATDERNATLWQALIVNLTREVVSSVDPDVRGGDSLDIRPYVKIKIIPGGSIQESEYVDGVVLRKNVAHKKMSSGKNGTKVSPRLILLAGGIEFQRTDTKLSSMDTLIEQEDKYMEILVDKIMSMKPDIILVGKSVARKAQELLCGHNVIVMQNVKLNLLEKIGRMTGATLLPSTDHMIKQFGDECMGSCEYFYMRVVQDDPEKMEADTKGGRRILKTRIARGSTYAYVTGCPSEKGCSIVLRGDNRNVLSEVKKILRFCIVVAYHLRLEVAYYNDRSADLPESPMDICSSLTDNESGDELTPRDGAENRKMVIDETGASLASSLATTPVESSESYPQSRRKKSVQMNKISSLSLSKSDRLLLSTSLDIDPKLPHKQELIGSHLFQGRKTNWNTTTVFDFQTLLITSLLMGDNNQQKSSAEVKGVKFYTEQDVALGKFLIENCFQLHRTSYRESRMVEHTLSYIHRPGRIDISIHRRHDHSTANQMMEEGHSAPRDPMRLPIFMESYCKVCGKVVTPSTIMSDETWKMSFGKFMEIFFYNKSARCIVDSCYHSLRDNHILSFLCEGYAARFEFVPIHPYSLHVRVGMDFPVEFYNQHVVSIMKDLPKKHATLISDFKLALGVLEKEIKDILATKPEDMALTLSDVQTMNTELYFNSISFLEKMIQSYELLPSACQKMLEEDNYKMVLIERLQALQEDKQISVRSSIDERLSSIPEVSCSFRDVSAKGIDTGTGSILPITSEEAMKMENLQQPILDNPEHLSAGNNPVSIFGIAVRFPAYHYRDTAIKAAKWNSRIDTLYKFLESVRTALLQQLNEAQLHPSALLASESIHNVKSLPSVKGKADLEPEIINREEPSIDFDQTVVESANEVIATVLPSEVSDDEPSVRSTSIVSDAKPLSSQNTSTLQAQHVSGILEHTPLSTISALSKTLLDHSKKIERPHDRVSRLPKLLTRFLVGKDLSSGEHNKFFIPLGDFGEGRYGLKPGRKGEVIAVHEDEFSTIIAYALASEEYYEQLQLSLKENENAVGKSHHSNSDLQEDFVAQTEDYRTSESVNPFFRGDDNNFDEAIQSSEQTLSKEEADVPTELIISPRLKGKGMSGMLRGRSVTAAPVLNRDVEESTRNEDIRFLRSLPRSNSEAVKKAQFVEGDAVDVERAFSQIHSSKSVIEADNLFATNAFQNPEMIDTSEIIETGKEEITMKNILNNTEKAPKRSSALNSVPQPTIGLDEKLKKQEKGKMESVTEIHGTPIIKTHSSGEVKTINEKQMISQDKSFISIRFDDTDDKGNVTYEDNENFIKSLSLSNSWSAQGGKSGASFSKSLDDRLVIKVISKVELTMFLEFAPAYFEYMAKAYYHNLPSVLCKILGVYSVRSHHKESGTKVAENVVVMENIFYQRNITLTFDLKGSSRARYIDLAGFQVDTFDQAALKKRQEKLVERNVKDILDADDSDSNHDPEHEDDGESDRDSFINKETPTISSRDYISDANIMGGNGEITKNILYPIAASSGNVLSVTSRELVSDTADTSKKVSALDSTKSSTRKVPKVLLDDNLMKLTGGRPFPLKYKAKLFFNKAVQNDTLFLSIVNVVDYSILVGFDEDAQEIVVGIIDYMRQYDFVKKMEHVGKGSMGILTGQAEPTIIQPSQYRKRFSLAMERYFMTVPGKWIPHDSAISSAAQQHLAVNKNLEEN